MIVAPRVSYITTDSCVIEWMPLKAAVGNDALVYVLQLAVSREQAYKQVMLIYIMFLFLLIFLILFYARIHDCLFVLSFKLLVGFSQKLFFLYFTIAAYVDVYCFNY